MTIRDREAAEVYKFVKDAGVGKAHLIANIADRVSGDMMITARDLSCMTVRFPNDDRMFNLEVEVFRTLAEANGIDVEATHTVLRRSGAPS